jgi:3-dehydroquinate synthase
MATELTTTKAKKILSTKPLRPAIEYPIYIGRDWQDEIISMTAEFTGNHMAAVIVDEEVAELYDDFLQGLYDSLPRMRKLLIKGGESAKTTENFIELQYYLLDQELNIDDCIISIGGGSISDLVGFVAGTFTRGLRWVSIPTTFLAMCDCAVGGKTSINLRNNKNFCGTFYWPSVLFVDSKFSVTQNDRYFKAAIPEVTKMALVGDADMFEELYEATVRGEKVEGIRNQLDEIIERVMQLKIDIVASDPYQKDERRVLQMGHATAHALEGASMLNLHHGEAVAMGLAFESFISLDRGLITEEERKKLIDILESCGLPTVLPAELQDRILIDHMQRAKRNRGRMINVILPSSPGQGVKDWPKSSTLLSTEELWDYLVQYRLLRG